MEALRIVRGDFHGKWNYTIVPRGAKSRHIII